MHTQTQTYYLARKTENFVKQDPYKTQQAQQSSTPTKLNKIHASYTQNFQNYVQDSLIMQNKINYSKNEARALKN